jgi:hypothetical protein
MHLLNTISAETSLAYFDLMDKILGTFYFELEDYMTLVRTIST